MGIKNTWSLLLIVTGFVVVILQWIQCCSCQHLAGSDYRLGGGQRPTDNITVLVSSSDNRKDDDVSIIQGPFVHYQQESARAAHQWNENRAQQMLQEEEEERRVRRDDYKERPTVDKDNSRLLVQTLNDLVRGTTKSALGETVDVFLGVRNIKFFLL